jgi:ribosomal protein S18 acetylase RimI-like enzyme
VTKPLRVRARRGEEIPPVGSVPPTIDPLRIEEAGLNALQTQAQLFYDGWLLRMSPAKAKRARSVNAHFGSTLPLDAKIERCERLYAARELPTLFRITPFCKPRDLDDALARRGYVAFDETLVQLARVEARATPELPGSEIVTVDAAAFVDAVAALRGSSDLQRRAHHERLAHSPLPICAVVARADGQDVACGQVTIDDSLAAIYDMVTADAWRGRGLATAIVATLLASARAAGASHAFLQVNADNAPARAVYRRFGFDTVYTYHYRARTGECG